MGYEDIKDKGFDKRTTDELLEITKKGGKASGEARRKKADFRKTLNALLTVEIDDPKITPILEMLGIDSTLESAMLMAQIKEAMSGNTKAAYFVAQYSGQSDKTDADRKEQEARTEKVNSEIGKIKGEGTNTIEVEDLTPLAELLK